MIGNIFKKATVYLVLFCMCFNIISCDGDLFGANAPQSISISPKEQYTYDSLSAAQSDDIDIRATVLLKSGVTSSDVDFVVDHDSENYSVDIQEKGRLAISIRKSGNFTIKAQAKYKGAVAAEKIIYFKVGDKDAPQTVEITPTSFAFDTLADAKATNLTVSATVKQKNGNYNTDVEFVPRAINETDKVSDFYTMISNGNGQFVFQIKKTGTWVIRAQAKADTSVYAEAVVDVKGSITGIQIGRESDNTAITETLIVNKNETIQLIPIYTPVNISDDQKDYSWELSDNEKVTITKDGRLTGVSVGECTITIKSTANPSLTSTIDVVVRDPDSQTIKPNRVEVTVPNDGQVEINKTANISAVVKGTDNSNIITGEVEWTSDSPDVISVEKTGARTATVTSHANGSALITASYTNTDTTVIAGSARMTTTGGIAAIGSDTSYMQTYVTGQPDDDTEIVIKYNPEETVQKGFKAEIEDPEILEIISQSEDMLRIRGLKLGRTKINFTSTENESVTGSIDIEAIEKLSDAERIMKVVFEPSTLSFSRLNTSETLSAKVYVRGFDNNQHERPDMGVSYENSNPEVVSMTVNSQNGTITLRPVKPGTATITATSTDNVNFSGNLQVEVQGDLKSLSAGSDIINISLDGSEDIRITPYPINSIYSTSPDQDRPYVSVKTDIAGVVDAELEQLANNLLNLRITPKKPGEVVVSLLKDGEEVGAVTVNVEIPAGDYIKSIRLDRNGFSMAQDGNAETITATLINQNNEEVEGSVTWELSAADAKVIDFTVSNDTRSIEITPKNAGYVTLTARSEDNPEISSICYIEVGGSAVQGEELRDIKPEYTSLSIKQGSSYTIGYSLLPYGFEDATITASSNDNTILRVTNVNTDTQKITVYGQKTGEAVVTVKDEKTAITADVIVNVIPATETAYAISLDREYLSYDLNNKAPQIITATVYSNGVKTSDQEVEWSVVDDRIGTITPVSVSDSSKAIVGYKGVVGKTLITASLKNRPDIKADCILEVIDSTVTPTVPTRINLSASAINMQPGSSESVSYVILPTALQDEVEVVWSSSDSSVASVSSLGMITANRKGSAVITATIKGYDDLSASVNVTVVDPDLIPGWIEVDEPVVNLSQERMDETVDITASVISTRSVEMADRKVTWTFSSGFSRIITAKVNGNVLSVSPKSAGTVTAYASYGSLENQTVIITVGEENTSMAETTALLPSTESLSLLKNSTFDVSVTPLPYSQDAPEIIWSSNKEQVATVKASAQNGSLYATVEGISDGDAVITAQLADNPSVSTTINVSVSTAPTGEVSAVVIEPQHIIFDLNSKALTTLTATVYVDGEIDTEKDVEWDISDSLLGAASFTEFNDRTIQLFKGTNTGSGYITAKVAGDNSHIARTFVETVDSRVIEAELKDITVSPSRADLDIGTRALIQVNTLPSTIVTDNGFNVRYFSSNEAVASVDSTGVITAAAQGSAQITVVATYKDVEIRKPVTVVVNGIVGPAYIETSEQIVNLSQEEMDKSVSVTATIYDTLGNVYKSGTPTWNLPDDYSRYVKAEINDGILTVTPLGAGSFTATAEYGNLHPVSVRFVVGEEAASKGVLRALMPEVSSFSVLKGETFEFRANPLPAQETNPVVVWHSSNEGVLTVTADPSDSTRVIARGISEGNATITAVVEGYPDVSASVEAAVYSNPTGEVSAVRLTPQHVVFDLNSKALTLLTATVYVDGKVDETVPVQWNMDKALDGIVSGIEVDNRNYSISKGTQTGSGYVTVSAGNDKTFESKAFVEVIDTTAAVYDLKGISVSGPYVLAEGIQKRITVTPEPSILSTMQGLTYEYLSENEKVATVSNDGIITAVGQGRTDIVVYATYRGATVSNAVNVEVSGVVSPAYIETSRQIVNLSQENMDRAESITAAVYDTDGAVITGAVPTWTLPNDYTRYAEADIVDGVLSVKPLSAGTFIATASYGSLTPVSVRIVVGEESTVKGEVERLVAEVANFSVLAGKTFEFRVGAQPSQDTAPEIRWISSNPEVLTVEADPDDSSVGIARGITDGTAVITASIADNTSISTTINATVFSNPRGEVSAVKVTPQHVVFDLNSKALTLLTATVYVDGEIDETVPVTWKMDTGLDQLISGLPVDNRSYSITKGDKTGSGYITVSAGNNPAYESKALIEIIDSSEIVYDLTGITVSGPYVLSSGTQKMINVTPEPAVLATDDSVTYEFFSEDESVATVSSRGVISAVGEGSTDIVVYAEYRGVRVSKALNVQVVGNTVPAYIEASEQIVNLSQEEMDKSVSITATIYDNYGSIYKGAIPVWNLPTDYNRYVKAEINNGVLTVTPLGAGAFTATVSYGALSPASVRIVVGEETASKGALRSLIPEVTSFSVLKGETFEFRANPLPAQEKNPVITWRSGNEGIVTVAADPADSTKVIVTGVADGTATITATVDGSPDISTSVQATVYSNPTGEVSAVRLSPQHVVFDLNSKALTVLTATVYVDGKIDETVPVKWTPDASLNGIVGGIAVSDREYSITKGNKTGSGYITVSAGTGKTVESKAFVEVVDTTAAVYDLTGISTVDSYVIAEGIQKKIVVAPEPSVLATMQGLTYEYLSENERVATVTSDGIITGVGQGQTDVVVYATYRGATVSKAINVVVSGVASPAYIEVSRQIVNISQEDMDKTETVSATVYNTDGKEIAGLIPVWTLPSDYTRYVQAEIIDGVLNMKPLSAGTFVATVSYGSLAPVSVRVVVGEETAVKGEISSLVSEVSSFSVLSGQTFEFRVSAQPSQDTAPEIRWISDNPAVLTISADNSDSSIGIARGISDGTAKITATIADNPSIKAEINATVYSSPRGEVSAVKVTPQHVVFDLNSKALTLLTATVYVDGEVNDSVPVKWSMDNDAAQLISGIEVDSRSYSISKGTKTGSGYVTVSAGNSPAYESKSLIEVVDSSEIAYEINDITVSGPYLLTSGVQKKITVTPDPSAIAADSGLSYEFFSENENVVKVDSEGVITTVGEGSTDVIVYATYKGKTVSRPVSVQVAGTATPAFIETSKQIVNLSQDRMDEEIEIEAAVRDSNNQIITGAFPTWNLPQGFERYINADIVNGILKVSPKGAGTITVTASYGTLPSVDVIIVVGEETTVNGELKKILPEVDNFAVLTGKTFEFRVNTLPSQQDVPSISWISNNPAIATVVPSSADSSVAVVTGVSDGTTTITAIVDGQPDINASVSAVVYSEPKGEVTAVKVTPQHIVYDLNAKALTILEASVYVDGVLDTAKDITWRIDQSLDNAVIGTEASNRSYSLVKGTKTGEGYVTVESGDTAKYFSRAYVEVVDSSDITYELNDIVLSNGSYVLTAGTQKQITVTPNPVALTGARGLTYEYLSENTSVATVNNNGVITAVGQGTTEILVTATYNGKSVSKSVSVTVSGTSTPVYIETSHQIVNLSQEKMDESVRITATVKDSNDKPVAGAVPTWTLPNGFSRYVNADIENGTLVVSPVNAGTITVTASYGSLTPITVTIVVGEETASKGGITRLLPELSSFSVLEGQTFEFGVSAIPAQTTAPKINWTSDNPSAITIQPVTGDSTRVVVTGVKEGYANIVASVEGMPEITATVTARVNSTPTGEVSAVRLTPQNISFDLNSKALTVLTATVYVDGVEDDTVTTNWTMDKSLDGAVSGVKTSERTYTLSKGNTTGTGLVTVSAGTGNTSSASAYIEVVDSSEVVLELNDIAVSGPYTITAGTQKQIEVTPDPTRLTGDANLRISYMSENETVARVSSDGVIYGVAQGKTQIVVTARYNDVSVSKTVDVEVLGTTAPAFIETSLQIVNLSQEDMDQEVAITASVIDRNGNIISGARPTWNLPDGYNRYVVANIENGILKVKPLSAGSINVTASYAGLTSAIIRINVGEESTVTGDVRKLVPELDRFAVLAGRSFDLRVNEIPVQQPASEIRWTSSDPEIMTVMADASDNTQAVATGIKEGNVTISAYLVDNPTVRADIAAEVYTTPRGEVTAVKLAPQHVVFDLNSKALTTLTATVYVDGEENTTETVNWTIDSTLNGAVSGTRTGDRTYGLTKGTSVGDGYVTVAAGANNAFTSKSYIEVVDTAGKVYELNDIILSVSKLVMNAGTKRQISATPSPAALASSQELSYRYVSGNDRVATVDSTGLVTAIAQGITDIEVTASYNGISVSKNVQVEVTGTSMPAYIETSQLIVNLSQEEMDKQTSITAVVKDNNDNTVTGAVPTWTLPSSYTRFVEAEIENGVLKVKPVGAGSITVTASYGALTPVTVRINVGEEITINGDIKSLIPELDNFAVMVGKDFDLSVSPIPAQDEDPGISWVSSDPSVLTVAADPDDSTHAVATGIADGNVTITATVNGNPDAKATIRAEVYSTPRGEVTAVKVEPQHIVFDLNSKALTILTAKVYVDGVEDDTQPTVWTIDKSLDGALTGSKLDERRFSIYKGTEKGAGYVTVSAGQNNKYTSKAYVEVVDSSSINYVLSGIQVSPAFTLAAGTQKRITVTPEPAALATAQKVQYTYMSENTSVATVSTIGVITAVAEGQTDILVTATYNGIEKTGVCHVTVTGKANNGVTDISITPSIVSFQSSADADRTVRAIPLDADGNEVQNTNLIWTIADDSVAEITPVQNTNEAVISPKKDGGTAFTVRLGSLAADGYVTVGAVDPDRLLAITSSPSARTIAVNEVFTPVVTAIPATMQNSLKLVFESDSDAVSIENGRISGVKEGNANVRIFSENDMSISTTIRVAVSGEATPTRIVLFPEMLSFGNESTPKTIEARIESSTGGTYNGTVRWSASDEAVITLTPDAVDGNIVSVKPNANGNSTVRALFGNLESTATVTVSSGETSKATAPNSIYAENQSVLLNPPNDQGVNTTAVLSVLYSPSNIAEEYKGIDWSIGDVSVIEKQDESQTGKLIISSVAPGTTTVTARSKEDPDKTAVFTVRVLTEDEAILDGIPEISMSRTSLSLDLGESTTVTSIVRKNGTTVRDGNVKFTNGKADILSVTALDNRNAEVTANTQKAGRDVVTAEYSFGNNLSVSAATLVEVSNNAVAGQAIRSVSLDVNELEMVVGESLSLGYTVTPQILVDEKWTTSDDTIATVSDNGLVRAVGAGDAVITFKATDEYGNEKSDTANVKVLTGIRESSKFKSLTPSETTISRGVGDIPIEFTLELLDIDENIDENTELSEVKVVGVNGTELVGDKAIFDIEQIGAPARTIRLSNFRPGSGYLEISVYDDATKQSGVRARVYVKVAGDIMSLSTDTKFLHLAVGDRDTVNMSYYPDDAYLGDNVTWTVSNERDESGAAATAGSVVELYDSLTTRTTVVANGLGTADVTVTYSDGTKMISDTVKVSVENIASLSGGVKKLSFEESFVTMGYPFTRNQITANVLFHDGTETNEGITYKIKDGADKTIGTLQEVNGVTYFTPVKTGKTVIEATYNNYPNVRAELNVTVKGSISSLTPSANNLILYTGGSTKVSVTPDDDTAPNKVYRWRVVSEKKNNAGNMIPLAASDKSALDSFIQGDGDGATTVVAALDVVTDKNSPRFNQVLYDSYPREAVIEAYMPDYPDVTAQVNVRVELLPAENTYPKSIELSSTEMTLTPEFTTPTSVSAVLTDSDGNETSGVIDWYYYTVGDDEWDKIQSGVSESEKDYKYNSWLDPMKTNSNDIVDAYLQENSSILYFTPKKAGIYRLKAISRENPRLQQSATLRVEGEVTGISSSVGNTMSITKDSWVDVNISYESSNALARDVFFILESSIPEDKNATVLTGAYDKNDFVQFVANGNSVSIKGTQETADPETLIVQYWDSETRAELENSPNEYLTITKGKSPMYQLKIRIDVVPKQKTINTLSISGIDLSIDPESITGPLSFTVSVKSNEDTSEGDTQNFKDWDWLVVDLVGLNNPDRIYASTIPSRVTEGITSIATGGKIQMDEGEASFVLVKAGIPDEPMKIFAHLNEDLEDGRDANDVQLFDPEKLGFNSGTKTLYVGGQVTEIKPGTTKFNLNNNLQETTGTDINLITGADAVLTVEYNPSYTHQKGVVWYVVGNDNSFTDYSAITTGNTSQCSVYGREALAQNQSIILRAVSIYDPWFEYRAEETGDPDFRKNFLAQPDSERKKMDSKYRYPNETLDAGHMPTIYVDYKISIRSPIETAMFTAKSQRQTNKGTNQYPEYAFMNDETNHPDVSSYTDIYCYDTSDASGTAETAGSTVDAYYIVNDLTPDYGYKLNYSVVKGKDIGSVDSITDIDEGENAFRFVPKGRVLNDDGVSYSVAYGEVIVRAECAELNFSQDFKLHYSPSNLRVVKYNGEKDEVFGANTLKVPADTWKQDWDVVEINSNNIQLYGMEAIVLQSRSDDSEPQIDSTKFTTEFPISIVSFVQNAPYYITDGVPNVSNPQDAKTKYAVRYSLLTSSNVTGEDNESDILSFVDSNGNEYFGHTGEVNDGFLTDTKITLKANKQGVAYLSYTVKQTDENGVPLETGGTITGGLMVYVISPVEQTLAALISNNARNTTYALLIPEKISKAQSELWFLGPDRGAVSENAIINGNDTLQSFYRGRTYASFTFKPGTLPISGGYFQQSQKSIYSLRELESKNVTSSDKYLTINETLVSRLIPKDTVFAGGPELSDVKILGEKGLKLLPGVTGLTITDIANGLWLNNLDSNGNLDFSGTGLIDYTHSNMDIGSSKKEIKKIILPDTLENLELKNNGLNSAIDFKGSASTLKNIDLSMNQFSNQELLLKDALSLVTLKATSTGPNSFKIENAPLLTTIDIGLDDDSSIAPRKGGTFEAVGTPSLCYVNAKDTAYSTVKVEYSDDIYAYPGTKQISAGNRFEGSGDNGYLKTVELNGKIYSANLSENTHLNNIISGGKIVNLDVENTMIMNVELNEITRFVSSFDSEGSPDENLTKFAFDNASNFTKEDGTDILVSINLEKTINLLSLEGEKNIYGGTISLKKSGIQKFEIGDFDAVAELEECASLTVIKANAADGSSGYEGLGTINATQSGITDFDNVIAAVEKLDLSKSANLTDDVTITGKNIELKELVLDNCAITSLSVPSESKLTTLSATNNLLSSCYIKPKPNDEDIDKLPSINISNNDLGNGTLRVANYEYINGKLVYYNVKSYSTTDWSDILLSKITAYGNGIVRVFTNESGNNTSVRNFSAKFASTIPDSAVIARGKMKAWHQGIASFANCALKFGLNSAATDLVSWSGSVGDETIVKDIKDIKASSISKGSSQTFYYVIDAGTNNEDTKVTDWLGHDTTDFKTTSKARNSKSALKVLIYPFGK